jgi:hypothetical protein
MIKTCPMKTLLIFLAFALLSCDNSDDEGTLAIDGRWELREQATISMDNVLVWSQVPENRRYILTFNNSGEVNASNRDCPGEFNLNEISGITLSISFPCNDENLTYLVKTDLSEDGELVLDDIGENAPDEGLRIKFIKL